MQSYLGVKQADGTIKRVMDYNPNNSQHFSCAPKSDNQQRVNIDFYFIPEGKINQAQHIGALLSDNLDHLHKGKFTIDISVMIDKKGQIQARMSSSADQTQKSIIMTVSRTQSAAIYEEEFIPRKRWGFLSLVGAFIYGIFVAALIFFLLSSFSRQVLF